MARRKIGRPSKGEPLRGFVVETLAADRPMVRFEGSGEFSQHDFGEVDVTQSTLDYREAFNRAGVGRQNVFLGESRCRWVGYHPVG